MKHIVAFLLAGFSLHAQQVITVDWSEKTLSNVPTKVDSPTPVKLKVIKINDFLYTYDAKLTYKPQVSEPISADELGAFAKSQSEDPACSAIAAKIEKAKSLAKPFTLEASPDGKFASKPLKASQEDWDKLEPTFQALENASDAERACSAFTEYAKSLQGKLKNLSRIAKGDHEYISDGHTLPGSGQYTIEVNEYYNKQVTSGGAYTASFFASSSVSFLTIGYMGSQVQNRSYDSVDVGTNRKELRIQGTGTWRPNLAVLLSYKLPWWSKLNGDKFGVAVSAGPVFRVTSNQTGSTATNVGAFAGLSLYLWERLAITPGFHVGEFSDMPLGFDNSRDRSIPAGIANPITGVNRWTTRFGIGITFHAADFKKLSAMATFKQTPGAASSNAAAAAKAPAAAGATDDLKKALETAEKELKVAKALREAIEAKADAESDPAKKKELKEAFESATAKESSAQKKVQDAKNALAAAGAK